MRTSIYVAGLSAGLFVATLAAAADSDDDSIVITATRTQLPVSEVGQAISVIDTEAIVTRQSDTVVNLLRTVPGVTIAHNGGIGNTTSVFIRGAESDQTVALIDGVKLNDPSAPGGGFDFGDLLVGNITRIEVLRGSQSVLWGSQAIGGVVNIITAEPTDTLAATARAEYGFRNTRNLVGNVSQKLGPVAASIGVGDFHTDGISAFDENMGGTERDGFRNFGAHAKFNIEVSDAVSVDLRGYYSNGKVGIDGFAPPTFAFGDTREYSKTKEWVGYSGLNVALFDGRFHNRVAATYTETKRNNFDPDGFVFDTFDANGKNTRFEYQGTVDITDKVLTTFGAETEQSRFVTASFGGPPTRGETRINSGYGEIVAKLLPGLTAVAGVRHDDHDQFGGKTTSSASAVWSPNNGATALRASFSQGFKAPTLFQLQSEYGNGLLRPESARGWDAGVTQHLWNDAVELGATAFRRNSHDLINFVSCFEPFTGICANRPDGTYDNVSMARSQGVEVTLALHPVDALQMQANYSHVESEDRSPGATFGKDLVRRPRDTASAIVDYRWAFGLQTGATLTHSGSSFDNASNTRRVEGYSVLDLRVSYPMTARLDLQARVENVFDKEYETIYRYGMPGRAAFVGARMSY